VTRARQPACTLHDIKALETGARPTIQGEYLLDFWTRAIQHVGVASGLQESFGFPGTAPAASVNDDGRVLHFGQTLDRHLFARSVPGKIHSTRRNRVRRTLLRKSSFVPTAHINNDGTRLDGVFYGVQIKALVTNIRLEARAHCSGKMEFRLVRIP